MSVMANYLRKPQTFCEMRWFYASELEDVAVRAKRNPVNIPDMWDDYWRSNTRSWKKYRKTQWK